MHASRGYLVFHVTLYNKLLPTHDSAIGKWGKGEGRVVEYSRKHEIFNVSHLSLFYAASLFQHLWHLNATWSHIFHLCWKNSSADYLVGRPSHVNLVVAFDVGRSLYSMCYTMWWKCTVLHIEFLRIIIHHSTEVWVLNLRVVQWFEDEDAYLPCNDGIYVGFHAPHITPCSFDFKLFEHALGRIVRP